MQSALFVTGATGHAGSELARRAQLGGMKIRALIRSETQASVAKSRGWEPLTGDLTKPATLEHALDGIDYVLHCAAYGGPDLSLARAVNVEGTRTLASLARKTSVKRFVHISTISVHGDPMPLTLDEDSPLATEDPTPYCATKALREIALREVRDSGLEVTILRPGAICNVLRSQWGNEMVDRIRTRGWPPDLKP